MEKVKLCRSNIKNESSLPFISRAKVWLLGIIDFLKTKENKKKINKLEEANLKPTRNNNKKEWLKLLIWYTIMDCGSSNIRKEVKDMAEDDHMKKCDSRELGAVCLGDKIPKHCPVSFFRRRDSRLRFI